MKKTVLLFTVLLALVIVVAGCDDDDDSTGPALGTPAGFVNGTIYLDPETYVDDIRVIGYGAVPPNLDSVKVGDSVLIGDDYLDYDYETEYHENWWEIYFSEDGDTSTYMYDHGDMAQIWFYGDGQTATARFKILDEDSAGTDVTMPDYDDDTVAVNDSVTVYWNESNGADYYAVWLEFRDYVNGTSTWFYKYDATTDTSYMVTPDMYTDSMYYMYLNVVPFTGPDPRTGEPNVTGGYLTGKIYSYGDYDYTRIQGWNRPPTKAAAYEEGRLEIDPKQIVEKVYEQFNK